MEKRRSHIASGELGRRSFLRTGMMVAAGALLLPRSVWGALREAAQIRRRTLWAMGGWHHLSVAGDDAALSAQALQVAVDELRLIDRTFSVFDDRSPLSLLNQSQETTRPIDDALLAEGLGASLRIAAGTDGAFDPTVELLMHRWGFRAGIKNRNQLSDAVCDYREMEYDAANALLRCGNPAMAIDPGGWAKGWAAQRAAEAALRIGVVGATVNCGGDIYYAGTGDGPERQTKIRNPNGGRFDTMLKVRHRYQAVATSANTESFRQDQAGKMYGHLLDPQTQSPADSDCVSVTVFGHGGLNVDAIASALFVMGSKRALEWLTGHPEFAAVLIQEGWLQDARRIIVHGAIRVEPC